MKNLPTKTLTPYLFTLVVGLSLSIPTNLSATALLYYRFGDQPAPSGYEIDSGTLGINLTGAATTTEYTLPGSGAGSHFPNPVPLTAETNTRAAQFPDDNARLSAATGQLGLGDSFTIEAFVNLASFSPATSTRMIASQWHTTGEQRSWFFGVDKSERLRLQVSGNGTASTNFLFTDYSFSLNKDYYVAAVFNQGSVTFYQQNLTDDGELLTQTIGFTSGNPTSAFNSTGTFQIGNFNTGQNTNQFWDGIIDEVRLSNVSLASSDLLITIPEPSTFVLLVATAAFGVVILRRRIRS